MTIDKWYNLKNGDIVVEISSRIEAKVVDLFDDGELYLDDGSNYLSPISEYDFEDFDMLEGTVE